MNENKKPIMSLKEFANTYADFYKNDIQMILAWSVYNGNQPEKGRPSNFGRLKPMQ